MDSIKFKGIDVSIKITDDNGIVTTSTNRNNKNMIIKVTDKRLLEKTGGIIQGMSGSPILQDGKFVGAVTHVMVNNPEKGYGIFADTMLKQMKEVEKN